jgi:hypothetical protein
MKKIPLVPTFDVAPMTEALDKLEESIDADPFLFCGGKTIIAREALAPLGRAIDSLVHTHPSLRSDRKTIIALEHLLARCEGLLSRAGVLMANQGD